MSKIPRPISSTVWTGSAQSSLIPLREQSEAAGGFWDPSGPEGGEGEERPRQPGTEGEGDLRWDLEFRRSLSAVFYCQRNESKKTVGLTYLKKWVKMIFPRQSPTLALPSQRAVSCADIHVVHNSIMERRYQTNAIRLMEPKFRFWSTLVESFLEGRLGGEGGGAGAV